MASDQSDAAAERSAHVLRDEPRPGGVLAPMVEVEPGVWRLRIIVELEARLAAAKAERDAARAERDAAVKVRAEAIKRMADVSREAGGWQGIAEGKDIVIRQLEAERDAARADTAAAFARGAEAMRERAAEMAVAISNGDHEIWRRENDNDLITSAVVLDLLPDTIRALPLPEMEAGSCTPTS